MARKRPSPCCPFIYQRYGKLYRKIGNRNITVTFSPAKMHSKTARRKREGINSRSSNPKGRVTVRFPVRIHTENLCHNADRKSCFSPETTPSVHHIPDRVDRLPQSEQSEYHPQPDRHIHTPGLCRKDAPPSPQEKICRGGRPEYSAIVRQFPGSFPPFLRLLKTQTRSETTQEDRNFTGRSQGTLKGDLPLSTSSKRRLYSSTIPSEAEKMVVQFGHSTRPSSSGLPRN